MQPPPHALPGAVCCLFSMQGLPKFGSRLHEPAHLVGWVGGALCAAHSAISVRKPTNNVRALDKVPATYLPEEPGGWVGVWTVAVSVSCWPSPIPLAGRPFPPGSAGGQGGWVGVWTGWPRSGKPQRLTRGR